MVEIFLEFISISLAIICAILVLFLPAIRELIKPADSGPRIIPDGSTENNTNTDELFNEKS